MNEIKKYNYFVYIMTNINNKVLYIGVTNNLVRRVYEHKTKIIKGFTERYNINKLVYYEVCFDVNTAIAREKQLKGWVRKKKNDLVSSKNPTWQELKI